MNLELVIHEILQRKNFITIPGFGSIISQYQPARIIKSDHVKFIPPHKKIAFNPEISNNDSVLLNFLVTEYQLPEDKAQKEIEYFVKNTKQILEEQKEWKWEGVGVFYYDSGEKILFKEDSSGNLSLESFGLTDFSLHILPQEKKLEELLAKKKNESTSLPKKVVKTLFIISPLLLGAILIPNILHTQQYTGIISLFKNTDIEIDFSVPQKPKPFVFTNKKEAEEVNVNSAPIATREIIPEPSQTITTPIKKTNSVSKSTEIEPTINTDNKYFIIIGSFSTISNAKKLIYSLQSKKAGLITKDNKIRVYHSVFNTKEEAELEIKIIKTTSEYSTAWIYSGS